MKLETSYLGLSLKTPLVASASPLGHDLDALKRCEESGCAAVVLPSLFEEQLSEEGERIAEATELTAGAEAGSYFPAREDYRIGPDAYLEHIAKAKKALNIPVIASLNGTTVGAWVRYAKLMQQAGADALELNINIMPTDPSVSGAEVENQHVAIAQAVRQEISIPLAVKLGSSFSAPANLAQRLANAGANGLVLFNRFYQPDFDLDSLEVRSRLVLSSAQDSRLPLHWIAILYGRVPLDLALSSGVSDHIDVLKAMMAGASVACATSEILRRGPGRFAEILAGLKHWMLEHEYESIRQMRGSMSLSKVSDPQAFERANYVRELHSYRQESLALH